MKRTVSDNSLSNSREGKSELKFGGKSKGKLWPFIKKNKVLMAGPSVKWVLQSVEMFTLSFSLKGMKILSLFQNAKKKKLVCYLILRQYLSLVMVPWPWPCVLFQTRYHLHRVTHTNRLLTSGFCIMPFTPKSPRLLVTWAGRREIVQHFYNHVSAYLTEIVSMG